MKRVALAGMASAIALAVVAQEQAPYEVDGRRSGYLYMTEATRALQDDEFLNPAMFALEEGAALWSAPDGAEGQSCASCHADPAEMRGVAPRYPVYDEAADWSISRCASTWNASGWGPSRWPTSRTSSSP
jgi:sulfur-oxidizing protein SoxA